MEKSLSQEVMDALSGYNSHETAQLINATGMTQDKKYLLVILLRIANTLDEIEARLIQLQR